MNKDLNQCELIIMCGLPGSGKSTYAAEIQHSYTKTGLHEYDNIVPIVSPDAIRYALYKKPFIRESEEYIWAITKTMILSLMYAEHYKVILDCCSINKKDRFNFEYLPFELNYYVMVATKEECIERYKKKDLSFYDLSEEEEYIHRDKIIDIIDYMDRKKQIEKKDFIKRAKVNYIK